ncbi:MAG: FtsX-like permease family protein [Treponema sp.]
MNKTVFKMAVKNLFANKAKMIITLSLIGIGTFLVILGLGVLNFALQQTRDVCISDFSGDILITGKSEEKGVSVELLGAGKVGVSFKMPKMPYLMPAGKIQAKLDTMPEISGRTRSIIVTGMLKPVDLPDSWKVKEENRGSYPFLQTLGVEPVQYQKVFPTAKVYEGHYPTEDDAAFLLVAEEVKQKYEKYYERTLNVGDEVVMTAFSEKSRQQKMIVTGFFTYAHPDTAIGRIGYADVNACRILAGMTLGARTAAAIPDSIDLSLTEKSEDDLFGTDEDFELISTEETAQGKTDFDNLLGSTELRDQLNLADNEAWHHIAIKLHDSAQTASVIQSLNEWFEAEGINALAVDWEKAMLTFVTAIGATRVLLVTMLVILSVVVLIVIMNTLVVAVMQRNAEIGTMRAIGAKKSFVRKIFFTESFFMSLTGVCIGVVLALIAAFIINSFDIRLNEILSAMFGGKKVRVSISFMSIIGTMAAMLIAGLAANWYPVRLALKISPLEAINK